MSGSAPEPRPCVSALADVELDRRVRELELLRVRVDRDEVDLRDARVHHPVDGVDACTADADDADHGEVRGDVARDVSRGGLSGIG